MDLLWFLSQPLKSQHSFRVKCRTSAWFLTDAFLHEIYSVKPMQESIMLQSKKTQLLVQIQKMSETLSQIQTQNKSTTMENQSQIEKGIQKMHNIVKYLNQSIDDAAQKITAKVKYKRYHNTINLFAVHFLNAIYI